MENNKYGRIPKYQIIENDIIDKIDNGFYQPGKPLPTEAELEKEYSCSRVTVRQALSNLSFKGYIYKNQGSGSFVDENRSIMKAPLSTSFTENTLRHGFKPKTEVREFSIIPAGTTIAQILKINPTDKIYYIERVRSIDDSPVIFEKTFMSVKLHPQISIMALEGSKYQYSKDFDIPMADAYQSITPLFASDYIADILKITTKQPILRVNDITYTKDGQVFDYSETFINSTVEQTITSHK